MQNKNNALTEALEKLLQQANGQDTTLDLILTCLAKRGYATLLVLLSLPFCLPIQIPGFSTPFGIVLALIGLRIAFGRRIWLPQMVLQKKISYPVLEKVTKNAIKIAQKLSFLTATRLTWLSQSPVVQVVNGLLIFILSLFLALPLPIPFTNLLTAVPILIFGFAILEDDGVLLLIAYVLTLVCFGFYAWLYWIGKAGLIALWTKF